MSSFIPSDILRQTQIKNFIVENIVGLNEQKKSIGRHLIEMILPIQRHPLKVLQQRNQLIGYLKMNTKTYIEQFIKVYNRAEIFKLTKYGQYCAEENEKYIIFSQSMVSFICVNNRNWEGFCYLQGVSAYIGQVYDMEAKGQGKCLYAVEHMHSSTDTKRIIYHEYEGLWQSGQIKSGKKRQYKKYGMLPFLQYTGLFQNFSFHDQNGILQTKQKTLRGKFEKGFFVKNARNSMIEATK